MNSFIESLMGMDKLSDQVIVTDLLLATKSSVRSYAVAITETTSPEIRTALRNQLSDAIATHQTISKYVMKKGYYHPYDPKEQKNVDMQTINTVLSFPNI